MIFICWNSNPCNITVLKLFELLLSNNFVFNNIMLNKHFFLRVPVYSIIFEINAELLNFFATPLIRLLDFRTKFYFLKNIFYQFCIIIFHVHFIISKISKIFCTYIFKLKFQNILIFITYLYLHFIHLNLIKLMH